MKILCSLAVAVSVLAPFTLVAADWGPSECKPGETTPVVGYDTYCRCGVFFPNWGARGVESLAKNEYCSSRDCGDFYNRCCTQAATDCLSDPRSAHNLRWWDTYKKASVNVADGDYRIVTYCRDVKCSNDMYCIEQCFKGTTIGDVVYELDRKATNEEFDSVYETCEDKPDKSRELDVCAIDAYRALNPNKFPVYAINEPDFYAEETLGCDARKLYDDCLKNPPEGYECSGNNVFNHCITLNRERLAKETPANEGHTTDVKLVIQC